VRDRDRAGGRVADLHRRGVEDGTGARPGHRERARGEGVGRDRGRGRREVGEGPSHGRDGKNRDGREAEEDLRQWEVLGHLAYQSFRLVDTLSIGPPRMWMGATAE